jgi:Ca2+-binding RTX toxin-like protein
LADGERNSETTLSGGDAPSDGTPSARPMADGTGQHRQPLPETDTAHGRGGTPDYFATLPDAPDYWAGNAQGTALDGLPAATGLTGIVPTAMAAGDLDGDGRTDIVVGHQSGIKILRNDGEWSAENVGIRLDAPLAITVADVDGDGHADIVIRNSRELVLMKGHLGNFGVHVMSWPGLGNSPILAVGSFNIATPSLELLTFNANTGALGIIAHNGTTWQPFRTVHETTVVSVRVQDVNQDGLSDVYVENSEGEETWLISDGQGNFAQQNVPDRGTSQTRPDGPTFNVVNALDSGPSKSGGLILAGGKDTLPPDRSGGAPAEEPEFDYLSEPDQLPKLAVKSTVDASTSLVGVRFELNGITDQNGVGSPFGDHITGDDRGNVLVGGDGGDWLDGRAGDDTFHGGEGDDWMLGGGGNDLLLGQSGNDVLFGDEGDDLLYGGDGLDVLFGGSGADTLLGGAGDDVLFGGHGNDILHGGKGSDILRGDAGSDTFHYESPAEGGDIVTGFTPGEDVFEFAFGAAVLRAADAPCTRSPGEAFVWESAGPGSGMLYYDPDTSLSGDEILMAEVEMATPDDTLTIDDITLT